MSNILPEETQRHLELLGYEETDPKFLRAILNNQGKKLNGLRKAEYWNQKGWGIYFVVNGCGHSDKEVFEGRALFCEFDDRPVEEQIDFWQPLGLPEPTFQLHTGGKSIHTYWVFPRPIAIGLWSELQADLLTHLVGSDQTIKNPSRVMRLAGYKHQTGDVARIVNQSGKKTPYEVLRRRSPTPRHHSPRLAKPQRGSLIAAVHSRNP
ncbi:MAG: hypothetical protein HC910_21575 [Spirulinaceae cyanobacterium SM2_1_0]|nr:hypothetical protein [Spirulinaceae cyanobacterium SM2_1_0]